MKVITNNEKQTIELGYKLGSLIKPHSLITLSGDLGAGKTTFTKGIGKGMNITRVINSPTFTILKQYQGSKNLSHFDAYRLEGQDDELGFEEVFDSNDVCVVEWANFIENILPVERLEINIAINDKGQRVFTFNPIGDYYKKLMEDLL
ncbi:MAG: tRNA (adenosine(37)-N6)-threonylcarbamoyltransferase complex ATPase subunit type 1 TsaE [Thomasclavelia sp.]|nr:tRNA (adenosine(37)-N6)-threonylcarbamoyltransferase complex ATPase subunit type 1 TsaE [Thomasclavelia sp.]